jgi:hypothetical protein
MPEPQVESTMKQERHLGKAIPQDTEGREVRK